VLVEDVVKRFHEHGVREVPQQQLARGERLVVELGDVAVTLGAVVARVDDRLPRQWRGGQVGQPLTGTETTTMSPAAEASPLVAADARGPSSAAVSASVSGPRELLSTTWCPAAMASRAIVLPICPLPMNPTVVMFLVSFRKISTIVMCRIRCDSCPCHQLAGK
jgi:hypothetical protein